MTYSVLKKELSAFTWLISLSETSLKTSNYWKLLIHFQVSCLLFGAFYKLSSKKCCICRNSSDFILFRENNRKVWKACRVGRFHHQCQSVVITDLSLLNSPCTHSQALMMLVKNAGAPACVRLATPLASQK